jgi:SPP1 gp7 family putative phage head morphogenesis protein
VRVKNLLAMALGSVAKSLGRWSGSGGLETRTSAGLNAFLGAWAGDGGGLTDPYGLSPWVQRAVKHISGPISQVGLCFKERTAAGEVEMEDPTLSAFWDRPAQAAGGHGRMSHYDVIEATVGWLCLNGEFFWLLDDTWLLRSGAKSPFIIARPDRMAPILDGGKLLGWTFTDGSGRRHPLIPDQVISSRYWNPEDDWRGAAPLRTALMAAESDYASGRFWKSLAESNGDLGETVIAPNGIDPAQVEQIKMSLRRKRAAAKRGKYEPMFLVGDLKTEAPHIQSPDAASAAQRLANRHEVFIALGVPPSFAEVTASYSIGSASDRYKLIEETCMPIAAKIAECIEVVSERLIGRRVMAEFDFDDHSTMQQVRAERVAAGKSLHERGMPWAVISEYLDLGLKPFAGWDQAWLPMALVAVPETQDDKTQDPREEGEEETPAVAAVAGLEKLLRTAVAGARQGASTVAAKAPVPPDKLWQKIMAGRAPYQRRVRVIVDRALFDARKEVLANLAEAEQAQRAVRSGAFDFLFDLGEFLKALVEPIFRVLTEAHAAAGAELLADELGSKEPFTVDANGIARLAARKNFIKDAATGMWEATRDSLTEGLEAGESFAKLAERVRAKFNGFSKERSMMIAVTETGIAMESGRHDAMVQSGAEWKQWLTCEDDRVRLTHYQVNGKIVPMDEAWQVGGVAMMYPCDPNGSPSEIINCRCIHGPVPGPDPEDIEGNNPTTPIPF